MSGFNDATDGYCIVKGRIGKVAEMEQLLRLVDVVRQRIAEHGTALRGSKALTRYALIDTWLPCLGWDIGDPAQVVPEYRVPSRQVRTAEG